MEYERRHEDLLPRHKFALRMVRHAAIAFGLMVISLGIGILGYHGICKLGWVDSLLNASFILTGMGPVATINSTEGKLFASMYALFSGVGFITTIGVLLVPVLHRMMHHFHMEVDDTMDEEKSASRS